MEGTLSGAVASALLALSQPQLQPTATVSSEVTIAARGNVAFTVADRYPRSLRSPAIEKLSPPVLGHALRHIEDLSPAGPVYPDPACMPP